MFSSENMSRGVNLFFCLIPKVKERLCCYGYDMLFACL